MKRVTRFSVLHCVKTLLVGAVLLVTAVAAWAEKPAADESLPSAVVWYMEMAKSGDADAQYNLGAVYESGFGIKPDPFEAVRWYTEAAEQDHPMAQLKLGILYVLGDGTRPSIIKGTNWVRASADNGNRFANALYDKVLSPNIVREMTAEEIVKKVRPFVDLGEEKSIERLIAILEKDTQKAQQKEPELAERFTSKSKNTLGKEVEIVTKVPEFLDDSKPPVNFEDSNLALLHREANAGIAAAQYELGRIYDSGEKVGRDRQKSITWFTSAANQGHAESQYRLAIANLYGIGVNRNVPAGESWLSKAAKQNHPVAKQMLPIYMANRAANVSTSIALSWYLEKAVKGEADGQFGIGNMYENGWGINLDNTQASKWFSAAHTAGSEEAERHIRQLKAIAASQDPDPAPENRPRLPEKKKSSSVTPAAADRVSERSSSSNTAPARNELVSNRESRGAAQNGVAQNGIESSEAAGVPPFMATIGKKAPLAPLMLILLGIILGILVFKWMRRGAYKSSVF